MFVFLVDNNESTKSFPEDNSLMNLDKTLVRSDDHDATIKKDYVDVDLSKTSNKRTYSDSQYCPFKKCFKGLKGNEFTHDQSGVGDDQFGVGEGADIKTNFVEKQSQSPEDSYSQEVISLVKRHFIVQDLGVAEMLVEGDSQIHIYVHAKDDLKELVQRLIVHIGENKGWEVYFQKVPIVQISNIQHLIGSGQTSIVYTDIALENNNPLESTEKISDDTDASNSNPVSDRTQGDVHVEVTNTDDVVNGSSKTPVVGGAVRYSVHARVTNTDDVANGISKTPVVGGEVRYSVHARVTNTDDNGDKEMGDEPSQTDDGGKTENDSGTSNSEPDSESSDSKSSSSGSSEYQSSSADKSSGESSKSSKLGSEKSNVHDDNNTVACNITSEQKDSAEVPTEEKDEESHSQNGDGGVPDHDDEEVSEPGDDLLLEKLMRETEQLEEPPLIPGQRWIDEVSTDI